MTSLVSPCSVCTSTRLISKRSGLRLTLSAPSACLSLCQARGVRRVGGWQAQYRQEQLQEDPEVNLRRPSRQKGWVQGR